MKGGFPAVLRQLVPVDPLSEMVGGSVFRSPAVIFLIDVDDLLRAAQLAEALRAQGVLRHTHVEILPQLPVDPVIVTAGENDRVTIHGFPTIVVDPHVTRVSIRQQSLQSIFL